MLFRSSTRFRLTYVAGYPALPPDIRMALRRLIAFWYQNREDEPPQSIDELFVGKRVFML